VRRKGGGQRRTAIAVIATVTLIAAAVFACSTALEISGGETAPTDDGGGADGDGADGGRDSAGNPDVEPLPIDAAPISADASLDGYAPPGCPGDAGCDRVVFVTSTTVQYAAVATADSACTNLARAATSLRIKDHQFQAWVTYGVDDDPAKRFVHATGNYIRSDGTIIAAGWTDLVDSMLAAAIVHNENGNPVSSGFVWTGTAPNGTPASSNCNGWATANSMARVGSVGSVGASWTTSAAFIPCAGNTLFLYCFEK
jgi:hypothetical protein